MLATRFASRLLLQHQLALPQNVRILRNRMERQRFLATAASASRIVASFATESREQSKETRLCLLHQFISSSNSNSSNNRNDNHNASTIIWNHFHLLRHPTTTTLPQRMQFSTRSSNTQSLYELLDVPKTATAKEIKLAYFREAKKYHPDMNPNDPTAKERFQRVAAAYEILSDANKRRMYDMTGRSQDQVYEQYGRTAGSAYNAQQHAEDVFKQVTEDLDVIKEAFHSYREELAEELDYAVQCARNSDWKGLYEVAYSNKFLIFGVVVPLTLFLRYPPLVFWFLRAGLAVGNVALVGLLRTGDLPAVAGQLWRKLVQLSAQQKARAAARSSRSSSTSNSTSSGDSNSNSKSSRRGPPPPSGRK